MDINQKREELKNLTEERQQLAADTGSLLDRKVPEETIKRQIKNRQRIREIDFTIHRIENEIIHHYLDLG